eukprot:CAMPEP_0202899068 /NCGR_PEP_ID=MMETSP1392-20130828/7408_1 /ASSEMBLY_ACC=CAM_ASM_000868 /TAXON_ID=225041 /ORGANISM="Chlamydomonas chlamydogama, Strain SAG 11-48b" /LENGTH=106 /DNA_ID=CAMNT_0049585161 /DNA_START=47 /DNA_END=367 /DNA_ORIENTATION=+
MAFAIRSRAVARPAARTAAVRPKVVRSVVVRATPEVKEQSVADAIKDAEEACKDGSAGECAAAWDVVEEVSAAKSHKKVADQAKADPLEQFCEGNPDADECRVYDD